MARSSGVANKYLVIKRFGWKRVAHNTMRFGWNLSDAEEHTTTTTEISYDGEVCGDKVYIKEHRNTSTKISIHLSFWRRKSDYKGFAIVTPLEWFYNLCFYVRRLIGFFLPIATIVLIVGALFVSDKEAFVTSYALYYELALGIWLGLIVMEGILSRIAGKILGIKLVKR